MTPELREVLDNLEQEAIKKLQELNAAPELPADCSPILKAKFAVMLAAQSFMPPERGVNLKLWRKVWHRRSW